MRLFLSMMLMLSAAAAALGQPFVFDTPSDDRWHYWVNFTPGTRPNASCFGAAGHVQYPEFNDRDGAAIIAWDTATAIPPGLGPDAYDVTAVRVTLTNLPDAAWEVDLSPDEWYTFDLNRDGRINGDGFPRGDPNDRDGESDDEDAGRPVELFGAGFGPVYTYENWNERSRYVGAVEGRNAPRDPYPFTYQENSGVLLHVEDCVKGKYNENAQPPVFEFTPTPWAVGAPVDYRPGRQGRPFAVTFDVDLNLVDGRVRRYFQEQLNGGRVFVYVTSMVEIEREGNPNRIPNFYMKEGVGGHPDARAALMEITLGTGGVPCEDIRKLSARCRDSTLKVIVLMTGRQHDGRTLALSINDERVEKPIKGKKLKLVRRNQAGARRVCVVEPDCGLCKSADCG